MPKNNFKKRVCMTSEVKASPGLHLHANANHRLKCNVSQFLLHSLIRYVLNTL